MFMQMNFYIHRWVIQDGILLMGGIIFDGLTYNIANCVVIGVTYT